MATLPELLERVHGAEPGPHVIAAFDYDGTLIRGFSAKAFYEHRLRSRQVGPKELATLLAATQQGFSDDETFARFMNDSLAHWAGLADEELDVLGRRLFKEGIASRLHREAYALVEAHRRMGHTLVLASSALRYQTEPMAQALGFDHVLHTEVEIRDGLLTGRALGMPMYGEQKARGLFELAEREGADLTKSFGYSNGGEDVPFLSTVMYPTAVEPDGKLRRAAELRAWPVLRCKPTGTRPGPIDVARTAGFYGGFFTTMGAGIGVGLLRRSRRTFLDIAIGTGSEVSLAIAGVDVKVIQGAEHLWGPRPAVFIFNHTSKMDAFVAMKLLRENFTGVAKAEAKSVPVFGQLFQAAGMAFIERGNTAQALDALAPVVEKLRSGTSIVLSPEGTRTPTPRLGPFKKGAFHMAMQGGVPIVPMLFRGVDAVQWRGAQVVRPGTVEVVVLPPVDTSGWRGETVDEHRDAVRALMLDTLENWPGDVPPALPRPESENEPEPESESESEEMPV